MNFIPSSDWLKALDIKGSVAFFISMAGFAVFYLAKQKYLGLETIPHWLRSTIVIVSVFLLFLALARIWDWLTSKISKFLRKSKLKKKFMFELDNLSDTEHEFLAYLVSNNQSSFVTSFADAKVVPLLQKGLIRRASGHHSILDWPHYVPSYIWELLIKDKHNFQMSNSQNGVPWADRRRGY